MNNTAVFTKGTKFYLAKIDSDVDSYTAYFYVEDLINSDYWKSGVKNGIYTLTNSKQIKLVYYELNIAKDSVIGKDRFTPEVDAFVKKYLYRSLQ